MRAMSRIVVIDNRTVSMPAPDGAEVGTIAAGGPANNRRSGRLAEVPQFRPLRGGVGPSVPGRLDSRSVPMTRCRIDPVRWLARRAAACRHRKQDAAGRAADKVPAQPGQGNHNGGDRMSNFNRRAMLRASAAAAVVAAGIVTASAAVAAPLTLTWGMWVGSDAEKAAWQHVADMVTAKYPDIKIELQTASWPDYWTKLPTLAASGQLPDIVSLQSLRAPGFASLMTPLDDMIARDKFDIGAFDKSIIGGLSSDGHVLALPYDFGPLLIFYNADMLAKDKVDAPREGWTEAEFRAAAKKLTHDSQYGFGVGGVDQVISWISSAGATYLKDGNLDVTNDKFAAAFQDYVDLVAKDKVAPLLPASGQQLGDLSRGQFAAGNIAMIVDGPWQLINLKNSVKFKIGLAPVPAGSAGAITVTAGSGFGIANTSKHPEEAWKAIQVLTGPEAEQYLASQGRAFAARIDDQKYWYQAAAEGVDNAEAGMNAALKGTVPYVTTANWNTVNNLFEQYEPLALAGKQTGAQVLNTISTLANQ
jgi:ABC-type glycerol-3-phosphate transport system substrate-binding protein